MATIDTNMSLVMIDPNEPLELYDGTIIKGRLEWFLYALCCLDYGNLPTPLSRIEEWANALITNELPNMEPQSRAEEFFKAILTGDTSNLPTPQSRSEVLLDKLARGENDFTNVEKIQSRYEFLLAYLIKNGGGIGNIDYVLYKFQKEDETLYNTKERPVKSAILSGNTLVNLTKAVYGNGDINVQYRDVASIKRELLKPSTKYIAYVFNDGEEDVELYWNTSANFHWKTFVCKSKAITYSIGTSKADFNDNELVFSVYTSQSLPQSLRCVILEYVEGMENWDIPYFEGMKSVKMPVLTTIGKNLFDGGLTTGFLNESTGEFQTSLSNEITNYITVEPNAYLSVHFNGVRHGRIFEYDINKNYIKCSAQSTTTGVALNEKTRFVRVRLPLEVERELLQIEQNDKITSYEPYKSNILSILEPVELGGIGDVKDTLDLMTGENAIKTDEIVLDGTRVWSRSSRSDSWTTHSLFMCSTSGFTALSNAIVNVASNLLKSKSANEQWSGVEEDSISINIDGNLYVAIAKNKLTSDDANSFKVYLSQNNIRVRGVLKEQVVKTVDLTITDQGGATIPKLNTFDKITHVNVSATDILPEVEMEVATTIGEDLSGTLYSTMEDIETKQKVLKESNNTQTESVNSTMMATTEIYESLL